MVALALTYDLMKRVTADLYEWSLKKVPDDTKAALARAVESETNELARRTLGIMLKSAIAAETRGTLVCSDSGVPVYFVKLGTGVPIQGDIKRGIVDGFAELVERIKPPILKHVTNPLTNERGYAGRDMPIVTWDVTGEDFTDITCSPKALGSGRWAALEIFSFPTLERIEEYVMECVLKAGSQHCPPVVIGVGIGGTFDHCAKIAKLATLRPMGSRNPDPTVGAMEERLTAAVNKTGFGPMGTGGDTTTLGVHVEWASGHGFTPVAVCFNCWINRRTRARIHADGTVERLE
ncbi:fumarate hydratase [Roseomonas sp. CCTCC AB2023176]|uniref:fumarate hydratase n=1 Tax=Roseomonas sp. CCTCC AB2023176 TaxID=3342640 RepID=UPI0035E0C278